MLKLIAGLLLIPSIALAQTAPGNSAQQHQAQDANVAATTNSQLKSNVLLPSIQPFPENCDATMVGSFGSPSIGITVDVPRRSMGCERRRDVAILAALDLREAAIMRECQDDNNKKAMVAAYGPQICEPKHANK